MGDTSSLELSSRIASFFLNPPLEQAFLFVAQSLK